MTTGCAMLIAIATGMLLVGPRCAAQRTQSGARLESSQANAELQQAVALVRSGRFQEAIPRFLALQGQVSDFVLNFNLALCYVGTGEYKKAVEVLRTIQSTGRDTAEVENLLAQAYIGQARVSDAWAAVQKAARMSPKDEKLYLFAADACMDGGFYDLGLKVVELGLKSLPNSARLAFEHGMFLAQTDRFDSARADFQHAQQLAPGSDVAYIAGAQEALYAGNVADAARIAREGVEKGNTHFLLLTILGEALLSNGATPGQPDFALAQQALERVVGEHPNFASAQLALGKLYLSGNRVDDAIARLEAARKLDPQNAAVYSNLAAAYKRRGDNEKSRVVLQTLARINQQQVEKIGSAPGDRKAGYASRLPQGPTSDH